MRRPTYRLVDKQESTEPVSTEPVSTEPVSTNTTPTENTCIIFDVLNADPQLHTWSPLRDFMLWCKTKYSIQYFDMMACALYADPNWKYVIDNLSININIEIRASIDNTGSASLGGNWFLESHTGVNLKTVYFTDTIDNYDGSLYYVNWYNEFNVSSKLYTKAFTIGTSHKDLGATRDYGQCIYVFGATQTAYSGIYTDGRVHSTLYNGSIATVSSGASMVYFNDYSIVILKTDGSVLLFGDAERGGSNNTGVNLTGGIIAVYPATNAWAALKSNGSVVVWGKGSTTDGGAYNVGLADLSSDVVQIYSTNNAFAALKSNGSVVCWGNPTNGGSGPSSGSIFRCIYLSYCQFFGLKANGSVESWGDNRGSTLVSSGAIAVYITPYSSGSYAILNTDGSVTLGGQSSYGGSFVYVWQNTTYTVTGSISSGVISVCCNTYGAMAALKADGSVICWGPLHYGGLTGATVTSVAATSYDRQFDLPAGSGVVSIISIGVGFAALKSNGSVVSWGNMDGWPSDWTTWTGWTDAVYMNFGTDGVVIGYRSGNSIRVWGYPKGKEYYTTSNQVIANHNMYIKNISSDYNLNKSYYSELDKFNILRCLNYRRTVNLTTDNNNVFTLTGANIKRFNPFMPTDKPLRMIIPDYSSSLILVSTITLPSNTSYNSFIITCEEAERVNINGTIYVNYGTYVYKVESNNTYTKTTTVIIDSIAYSTYGGDGVNSTGIALVTVLKVTPTLSNFTISNKPVLDGSFTLIDPSSNSTGAFTYSLVGGDTNLLSISGKKVTFLGGGIFTIRATQAPDSIYESKYIDASFTIIPATPTLSNFTISNKYAVDGSFTLIDPSSNSTGAFTYSVVGGDTNLLSISGKKVIISGSGIFTIRASQAPDSKYESKYIDASFTVYYNRDIGNPPSITIITPTITNFTTTYTKYTTDSSFALIDPKSDSTGIFTYTSTNTNIATISERNIVTIIDISSVTITMQQQALINSRYTASTILTITLTILPVIYSAKNKSNMNFTGYNFSSGLFILTNFTNSILKNTKITNANFTNAVLMRITSGGLIGASSAILPSGYYAVASGSAAGISGNDGYIIGKNTIITGMDMKNVNISGIPVSSFVGLKTGGLLNTSIGAVLPTGYVFRNGYIVGNGVSLVGADLSGQSFNNLSMRSIDLSGAVLSNTTFANTDLSGASLYNNNLSGLNLSTTNLTNVSSFGLINGVDGNSVILLSGYNYISGPGIICGPSVNLSYLYLSNTNLSSQNLTGSNLSYSNLTNVNFTNANLTNVILTGATLTNANLTGANLTGVVFSGAQSAQLLNNSANTNITSLQSTLLTLKSAELPNISSLISIDHVRDLSTNANVITPTLVSPGVYNCTITVDAKTLFFINIPALGNMGASVSIQINLQSLGGINLNANLVTIYTPKTFTLTQNSSDPNDVSIIDTTSAPSRTVTNSIIKLGNVLFKLYSFPMIGIPFDVGLFNILNIGIHDVLTNSIYINGPTGITGSYGIPGTNGIPGPTGIIFRDGPSGVTGPPGTYGPILQSIIMGPTGITGSIGIYGTIGPSGPIGSIGILGNTGPVGPAGIYGITGPTGSKGIDGINSLARAGPSGVTGPTGITGPYGGVGPTGMYGPTGSNSAGMWTIINPNTPESITGYTNIHYSAQQTAGQSTTIGINSSISIPTNTVINPTSGVSLDTRYAMDIMNSGSIKTVGVNTTSDYRIKMNIEDLTTDKTLDGLRPVKYTNKLSGKEEYGFIAHELGEKYPEMVIGEKDDTGTYQTIQYNQLFAICISEIKQLNKDIERLESNIYK